MTRSTSDQSSDNFDNDRGKDDEAKAANGPQHVDWPCAGPPRSLYDAAMNEANIHRWIESEKHGRDLGKAAVKDWFRKYWLLFCRAKWLQHVVGRQKWSEFAEQEYGRVYRLILNGDLLLDRILDRMEYRKFDNLEIIRWAGDWGLLMDRVLHRLELININRARLEPFE